MLPRRDAGLLDLDGASVPYELRRSRRRRTLGLTVTPQQVRIHAPSWTPRAEIAAYLTQQRDWLHRAWTRMQARAVRGDDGVLYLGVPLKLRFDDSLFVNVYRRRGTLIVESPPHVDRDVLLRSWLHQRAARLLHWRLARIARRLGRGPARFALSDAKTQWGSCTRRGHIRLNWRLVQAPLALIDYVAAHELAHLVHLDHSPRFWAQCEALCADARAKRTALRAMGNRLFQV